MEIVSDSKLLLINFLALLGKCTVLLISKFHQLNYQKTFFPLKLLTCGFAVGGLSALCEGQGERVLVGVGWAPGGLQTNSRPDPHVSKSRRRSRPQEISLVRQHRNASTARRWSPVPILSLLLTLDKQWSLLEPESFL